MKKIWFTISILFISSIYATDSDWSDSESWGEKDSVKDEGINQTYEEAKIQNRSKKVYDDRVYKYITGDYNVANNNIELATIHLDDKLQNDNVEVNVLVEDLKVEGNNNREVRNIKKNKYKNFVNNDERENLFYDDDEEEGSDTNNDIRTEIRSHNPLYSKVNDPDISELEVLDLRGRNHLKEVNVFIENVDILVD